MSCFLRITGLLLLLVWFTGSTAVAQSWDWASTAGGSSSDKGLDMDIDADGNLYVCGFYNFQANFDTINTPNAFGKEGFIAKIDPSGAWQWVKIANGGWDERVLGICVDKVNEFVYATGTTWYDVYSFGSCTPPSFSGSADNIFVGKFDLNGNCIWTILAGGGADDHGYDLVTDQQGNIYLTGFISDEYFTNTTAVFGSISVPIALGDSIAFVAKMSPADGSFQWVRTFDGTYRERDNRIAVDSDANVYITGGFWGTKTLGDTTITAVGGQDIFVIKFDKDGNQIWTRTVGSPLGDRGNSITVDQNDNIYVTGEFRDTLRFGTDDLNNYGSPGGRDIFVARITRDGEWLWATKAGSNGGQEKGTYITSNDNENIFVTGLFKRTAKFGNITITSNDTLQAFVGAISTTGVWCWVLQGGGTFADRGSSIAVDESCNVYVAGYYVLNADFGGNTLTGLGLKDVFVAKVKDGCFVFDPPEPPPPYIVDSVIIPPSSPQGELFIPNAFSPNGDGNNDVLKVYGGGISQMKLAIYNRWGEKVFETSTQKEGWDGTHRGKKLNSGVFAYKLNVTKVDNSMITKNGNITLMR